VKRRGHKGSELADVLAMLNGSSQIRACPPREATPGQILTVVVTVEEVPMLCGVIFERIYFYDDGLNKTPRTCMKILGC
jgi:hypothetical protein